MAGRKRKTWIRNNTLPLHQYIDVDSKCIVQGATRRTWAHTCRDGLPDLSSDAATNAFETISREYIKTYILDVNKSNPTTANYFYVIG